MDRELAAQKLLDLAVKIDDKTYDIFEKINPYIQKVRYVPTILFIIGLTAYTVWYHVFK